MSSIFEAVQLKGSSVHQVALWRCCCYLVPFVVKVKAGSTITRTRSEASQHIGEVDRITIQRYALAPNLCGRHLLLGVRMASSSGVRIAAGSTNCVQVRDASFHVK